MFSTFWCKNFLEKIMNIIHLIQSHVNELSFTYFHTVRDGCIFSKHKETKSCHAAASFYYDQIYPIFILTNLIKIAITKQNCCLHTDDEHKMQRSVNLNIQIDINLYLEILYTLKYCYNYVNPEFQVSYSKE